MKFRPLTAVLSAWAIALAPFFALVGPSKAADPESTFMVYWSIPFQAEPAAAKSDSLLGKSTLGLRFDQGTDDPMRVHVSEQGWTPPPMLDMQLTEDGLSSLSFLGVDSVSLYDEMQNGFFQGQAHRVPIMIGAGLGVLGLGILVGYLATKGDGKKSFEEQCAERGKFIDSDGNCTSS